MSDSCSDSKLCKRNMLGFSCTLSFPSLFWGLCIEVKDSRSPMCLRDVLLQWQCYSQVQVSSLGMMLPLMLSLLPACLTSSFSSLDITTSFLSSQLLTVRRLALSLHPFPSVPCRCFWWEKDLWGLVSKLPVGLRKRQKHRPDVDCSNLIPKEENPFSFHASLSPQAVQLCSGINLGGHCRVTQRSILHGTAHDSTFPLLPSHRS